MAKSVNVSNRLLGLRYDNWLFKSMMTYYPVVAAIVYRGNGGLDEQIQIE